MSKQKRLLLVLSTVAVLLCLCIVPAFADNGDGGTTVQGLPSVPDPIDPQSWTLLRDTNWSDFKPNPVIDWMTELNPDGLYNPSRHAGEQDRRNTKIKGAIILVDFWDRPFLMLGEKGSDLFGWHAFSEYDSYQDYLDKIEKGEPVTYNPQRVVGSEEELLRFWEDFLNKKITDETLNTYNHGSNVDEFWREVSYGKWGVDLEAFGIFHLEGFEMEYGLDYTTWADYPPTFRRGASGTSGQRNFVSESIAAANANDVWLGDYDFFFICHSGYDESGVWMEFGQLQWADGKDVPYEYGVQAKMEEIEEILTANPDYITKLAARGGYNQSTTIADEAAKIAAMSEEELANYEFKFPQSDWNWANNYIGGGPTSSKPGTDGGSNTAPSRYVSWTSWAAAATRWASSSGYNGTTVKNSKGENVTNIPYSQQAECNGMATYAHEFGHIVSLSDNYSNSYGATYSPDSEPWDLLARGCFAGPFGDHARWSVPGGLEADSVPVHLMTISKKRSNMYDPGDLLEFTVADLKAGTPVVAEVVARNIPMNNAGLYPELEEKYGLVAPNFYKGIELTFDSANPDKATRKTTGFTWTRIQAGRMTVEVVDRTGYDSYNHDHGVILSRLATGTGQGHTVIDSHLYDLDMTDYYLNGEPVKYTMGNQAQLGDGAFHAGVSTVDTGYYRGGEFKGDKRVSDEVISGSTVNEFHDAENGLHFYILDKHINPAKYGEFLSYQVGMLHDDGVAVGGELTVTAGELIEAMPGLVAQQDFTITNTGDATDIVRVSVSDIDFPVTLLNNLYAIKAGETITVPVYVEIPFGLDVDNMQGQSLIFTASSETNALKTGIVAISTLDLVAGGKANLRLVTDANLIKSGDYFRANAYFREAVDGNTATVEFVFDTSKFSYRGFTPAEGVEVLNTATTSTGVKFTFMKRDYVMKSFGEALFSAKEDIDMAQEVNELKVIVDYVERVDGEKEVKREIASTCFTTLPPIPIPEYSLIVLSNLIDVFGIRNTHKDWNDYRFYDFNKNNQIDILDICNLASKIQQ